MGELIRAYQNAVTGEIARFEGHVAKFMGDGVLAYFGWPRAHEDEAERAVRAGLAIAASVARLPSPAASRWLAGSASRPASSSSASWLARGVRRRRRYSARRLTWLLGCKHWRNLGRS